jgi:hypothetical protein
MADVSHRRALGCGSKASVFGYRQEQQKADPTLGIAEASISNLLKRTVSFMRILASREMS